MKTTEIRNIVAFILALFKSPVLLVAWPRGKKGCKGVDFTKITPKDMADPVYLYKLSQGNIGVVQGQASGGIASIDIDDDNMADQFLALNPDLKETLRSRGARGCNVWFYPEGEAPQSCRIRCHGQPWGEWRFNGNQTIIAGMHPTGVPYTLLNATPAIHYPFNKIIFPAGVTARFILSNPPITGTDQQTQSTDTTVCGSVLSGLSVPSVSSAPSVNGDGMMNMETIEAVLVGAMPTQSHSNHEMLFSLARQVKAFEVARKKPFNQVELEAVFLVWYERAGGYLRANLSYDEYLYEFIEAHRDVKRPAGENLVDVVWRAIDSAPMPPEAALLVDPNLKKLVTFCHALQGISHPEPFFLACRTVQHLFGLASHERAAKWLRILQAKKIIKITSPGGPKSMKASRYFYLGSASQKSGLN